MKKLVLFILLVASTSQIILAQQEPQYTQYIYNTLSINPGYAGSRGVFSITGMHRSQWLGIEGAPKTQTINFHTPVSERVGIGLSIVNDDIGKGTNQETYFDGVFSYTIPFARENKLAFGIKAGGHLLNVDFTKLANYEQEVLASGLANIDNKFSPNFGVGAFYYNERFYAGISIPNFLRTQHFDDSKSSNSFLAKERLNLYLMTGYVYDIHPIVKFKPALLLRAEQGAPLQVDVSANFLFNEKFTLGAAYRWDAALSAIVGFQINENLMLGLAYDRELSELGGATFNDGSFEILLRYEFLTRFQRRIVPRFF
ncbi:type IX secretion system membrane protein, PorP/SprF family [Pricia antarctica]|uniref:Type IX secretion system membrane protein, PorP/SprF family n=1 Tax=Pricia antarctica TaxID=641691 RepID=A0A1G6ZTL8_9FLAO|nr:type IX secretion system membrane protein PorP/SprF [Pricia antarctica]SDE06134.1 type IX secretion system membrane protein, PorP/SprF family [Pricia antarctica]